jgi:hypothetical protein
VAPHKHRAYLLRWCGEWYPKSLEEVFRVFEREYVENVQGMHQEQDVQYFVQRRLVQWLWGVGFRGKDKCVVQI